MLDAFEGVIWILMRSEELAFLVLWIFVPHYILNENYVRPIKPFLQMLLLSYVEYFKNEFFNPI